MASPLTPSDLIKSPVVMSVWSDVSPFGEEWIGEDDPLITVDDGSDEGGVKVRFADSTVVMISGWRVGEDGEEDAAM